MCGKHTSGVKKAKALVVSYTKHILYCLHILILLCTNIMLFTVEHIVGIFSSVSEATCKQFIRMQKQQWMEREKKIISFKVGTKLFYCWFWIGIAFWMCIHVDWTKIVWITLYQYAKVRRTLSHFNAFRLIHEMYTYKCRNIRYFVDLCACIWC